jgi:RNA-binding protein YhbY
VQYRDWRIRIGELGLHSKVTKEVSRRLNSDLKCLVSVLRSVARKRLVKTKNLSACAAVNENV